MLQILTDWVFLSLFPLTVNMTLQESVYFYIYWNIAEIEVQIHAQDGESK